jgi:uncharacterized membrane protein YidH (DUF202 family)
VPPSLSSSSTLSHVPFLFNPDLLPSPPPPPSLSFPSPSPSANERTFLAWLSMAVSLGGVSTALVGFTAEEKPGSAEKHPGVLDRKTVDLISVLLLPVSIAMIAYALFIFLCRSNSIRTKQLGFFSDWLGPAVLAGVLLAVLLTITIVAFASVMAG